MTPSYTLVTQSFGREYEYRRVIFSILSFYAVTDKTVPTVLFTDKPEYFERYFNELPIQYVLLTPDKITQMRGEIDFLHRMKIVLIEEALEIANTSILYADSDTFFLSDPSHYMKQLNKERSFMHIHEYQFEEVRNMALPAGKAAQAFIRYIEQETHFIPGTNLKITAQMSSWNAGVIMLHHSNKQLIEKVYKLTDKFFPASESHASEQYAFSIVLQSITNLKPVDDVIYHYWYNIKKKIVDQYLERELPRIEQTDLNQKMLFVKKAVNILPTIFVNHIDSLKDSAIQAFNDNNYLNGLRWTCKAFFKGGLGDAQFVRDFMYHTKRRIFSK